MKSIGNLTWQKLNRLTLILVLFWGWGYVSCLGQTIPSADSLAKQEVPIEADSLMVFLSRRGIQEHRDIHITFKRVHVLTRRRKRWRLKRNRKIRVFEGRIEKMRHAWLPLWRHKELVLKGEGIKGHFLAPGLIDMHAHLNCDFNTRLLMLRYGVTAVRDFSDGGGGRKERELINKRCLVSPLIYAARNRDFLDRMHVKNQPVEGIDFVVVDGRSGSSGAKNLSRTTLLGLDIACQGTQQDDWIQYSMASHFRTLEGLDSFLPADWPNGSKAFDSGKLNATTDGVWIVPSIVSTLGPFSPSKFYETYYKGGYQSLHVSGMDKWKEFVMPSLKAEGVVRRMNLEQVSNYHKSRMFIAQKLIQKGASLLVGTESGTYMPFVVPGYSFHEEMKILHGAGMTITEVLDAATLEAAKALRAEKDIGQVKRKMIANMVLLKGNPIKDLDHYLSIQGVMVQGFWLGGQEMRWIKRSMNELEPIKGRRLK